MKFLLVEDNKDLANAIVSRMEMSGHVIDHAEKLEDATVFVATGEYDLILLDIMLPDGDGRAFLRQHRASDFDTPVIVLTARSQVSDRIGSLDLVPMITSPSPSIMPNLRRVAVLFCAAVLATPLRQLRLAASLLIQLLAILWFKDRL